MRIRKTKHKMETLVLLDEKCSCPNQEREIKGGDYAAWKRQGLIGLTDQPGPMKAIFAIIIDQL